MPRLLYILCYFPLLMFINCKSVTFNKNVPLEPTFEEHHFDQRIDHFNFQTVGEQKYKQRYLITDQYWKKSDGPIFFYTGNEGDIYGLKKASGFLTDLAFKMQALVVFAEHRYYGTSLPFGNDSFTDDHVGFLTIEQALADYAYLIKYLKQQYAALNSPVIAFGGSYGGQLAAYIRIKYPNLVAGSLAASAPLYWLTGFGDRHGFWKSVTEQFGKHTDACVNKIKKGFAETARHATTGNFAEISQAFTTCHPLTIESLNHLYGWVRNAFAQLAMRNYPYPTNSRASFPGYPVNVACQIILAKETAMEGLAAGAGFFYNRTSSSKNPNAIQCFDIYKEYIECADPTGCGFGNEAKAWNYQACTEVILPGGSNNETDMFPSLPFTLEMRDKYCKENVHTTPRNDWLAINYWAENLKLASNIIFSNGDLDPWGNGGILQDLSPTLQAIIVVGGAHHLDLRGSNPKDPESVIAVRQKEAAIISEWVQQHWQRLSKKLEL
ncbi:dipeptidyl peptidase 2-like isoform X3 [Clavelina lepadiformis]|uniref:dipeptidyl peptidase 2-like isoform X3 n=1 Tax=Clavelina lepadiformis TaxID=159417 RepID=UPI0040420C04